MIKTGRKMSAHRDSPEYAAYFKMANMGVPLHIVQARLRAAGLDPDVFEYVIPEDPPNP
jgi:hypothetical protein